MSPKKRPPEEIQETEWLILNCLWELRSANPFEIVDLLRTRFHRVDTPKNVGIILGRMTEKGYLRSVPGPNSPGPGRPALVYIPLFSRLEALRRQFQLFRQRYSLTDEEMTLLLTERRTPPAQGE